MLAAHFHSSGDLIADRRFAYAQELAREGDSCAAAELCEQTLELVPNFVPAWFELGKARIVLGNPEAATAFENCLQSDPADKLGARLYLAKLKKVEAGDAMSVAYIRALFDSYALKFDAHLGETLNYRGPQMLRVAISTFCEAEKLACHFDQVLDIGCGTGLSGAEFRAMSNHLAGCDVSAPMVEQARKKSLYDELMVEDAIHCLNRHQRLFDLVLAADVLVYFGNLRPLFTAIEHALGHRGICAISLQDHEGDGFVLGHDMRFAHSTSYIEQTARDCGLCIRQIDRLSMRKDAGVDVPGLIVILTLD